jgi:hypothetical protein
MSDLTCQTTGQMETGAIKLPNRYNNTARLNLKIDRFQVNNEYSRVGMRTEQIHIEILNHISHTCKFMCTKKHNSAEG